MNVQHDFLWSALVHLSTNMWYEETDTKCKGPKLWQVPASSSMRLDRKVWNDYIDNLKASGVNTLVIDVGDGIVYDSHPELAIKGSWSQDEIRYLRLPHSP